MSGRFVRASKYRHVFGKPPRREQCYDNVRVSKNAWDTNLVKVNPKYLAFNWEASGGGAFAVVPLEEKGKLPEIVPLFRGHTAAVLDIDWNPFDDDIIASGSDDGKIFLWKVPENFTLRTDADEPADVKPVGKLSGHARKVGHVMFNPAAENVLASNSGDFTVKLWDLEDGKPKLTLKHNDMVQSMSWSGNGSMLTTTSRDKKLRFWDVRQEKPAHEVQGHTGAKNSRTVWMGDKDRVITTGFSRMSERQLGLWDVRNPTKPIGGDFTLLDSSSGIGMPFWDDGSNMLYIAGKGDGNIRYYEYENDKFEPLSEYKSPEPQRGMAFMPKRGVNTHENEIMRAYKTVNDTLIEPISFIVPRRAETFQDDIFPPAVGLKPAMSSGEWLQGKTASPPRISMGDLYEGNENPQEYAPEDAPAPAPARVAPPIGGAAPSPATKAEPQQQTPSSSQPETPKSAIPAEKPKMEDNKQSMANMASKFADKDDDEDEKPKTAADEEPSSFDEIQKPAQRPAAAQAARQEVKTGVSDEKTAEVAKQSPPPTSTSEARKAEEVRKPSGNDTATTAPQASSSSGASSPAPQPTPSTSSPAPTAGGATAATAAGGLKDVLSEIKGMIQSQGQQIESLTKEVAALKVKVEEKDGGQ
ncbi:hypothetical protein D0867_12722 [Hortaea werneckii]|uniref:Coronin n=2 Tax=Hortaea werneckii TaxID=91943 RepID=A0A3M6Y4B1_HORWE|nr:hypothetical protein D0867_12722 [Hortaea werneckii]